MFHIVCSDAFEYSDHGSITCTLYCETENGAFPDAAITFDAIASEIEKALRHLASSLFLHGDRHTAQRVLAKAHELRQAV